MIRLNESNSGETQLVRDLPNFTKPPLNEVVLSIQFAALNSLKSAHIGLFWSLLRADYPDVSEQAPIQPVFETFGTPPKPGPGIQIETFLTPRLLRYWFERNGEPDLLQLQQDRILHNWRQQSDNSKVYPRYEAVKERFAKEVELFVSWLLNEKLGVLQPNQCEVTYINIVALPDEGNIHKELGLLTDAWMGPLPSTTTKELEHATIQITWLFYHDEKPAGRVYATFQPAHLQSTGQPVIRLEITARGRPKGETVAEALDFLDILRVQVVRTFADITTPYFHQLWGRTDGQ